MSGDASARSFVPAPKLVAGVSAATYESATGVNVVVVVPPDPGVVAVAHCDNGDVLPAESNASTWYDAVVPAGSVVSECGVAPGRTVGITLPAPHAPRRTR